MSTQRTWLVTIDKKSLCKCMVGDEEQYLLIGYENGVNARKGELYFSQREKDRDSYLINFVPEPYFISYSFFNGFFGQTIKNFCLLNDPLIEDVNVSHRKIVLQRFFNKYKFSFTLNPGMNDAIKNYAEAMIENVIDIQAKMGKI